MSVSLRERFFRRKRHGANVLDTQLRRCLSTFDITLLGVGHMIGAGIYVVTGAAVKNTAGPSIVLSFVLAGFAALLSALCYAEFGARYPKAGSAYTYTYVGVGELWAFVIGWNVILEHVLAVAAVGRSWSGYLDSLLGYQISNITKEHIADFKHTGFFGEYPDFVAFIFICLVAVCTAFGNKASTNFNSVFAIINLSVIGFIVCYGLTFANFNNWSGTLNFKGHEVSRFFPYGASGMLAGAANCFFSYAGFDGIATAGEEAKNPHRSIPLATFIAMAVVTAAYVLMSATITLMVPFEKIHATAAFSEAFALQGVTWPTYIVNVGALCGMTTTVVGMSFALPRCVYAMADDGLLFRWLGRVNRRTQVPINAIVVFCLLAAVIAMLFDLETLVELLSIGTLLAYTLVSVCIIVIRYQAHERDDGTLDKGGQLHEWFPLYDKLAALPGAIIGSIILMLLGFCIIALAISTGLLHSIWGYFVVALGVVVAGVAILFIYGHKQTAVKVAFKVPLVPILPAASILMNLLMMINLSFLTWVRLAVWMTIGLSIYFFYGMKHSTEEELREDPAPKVDNSKSTAYEFSATETPK